MKKSIGNKNKAGNVLFWSLLIVSTAVGAGFAYKSFYRKDKKEKSKLKIVK